MFTSTGSDLHHPVKLSDVERHAACELVVLKAQLPAAAPHAKRYDHRTMAAKAQVLTAACQVEANTLGCPH